MEKRRERGRADGLQPSYPVEVCKCECLCVFCVCVGGCECVCTRVCAAPSSLQSSHFLASLRCPRLTSSHPSSPCRSRLRSPLSSSPLLLALWFTVTSLPQLSNPDTQPEVSPDQLMSRLDQHKSRPKRQRTPEQHKQPAQTQRPRRKQQE